MQDLETVHIIELNRFEYDLAKVRLTAGARLKLRPDPVIGDSRTAITAVLPAKGVGMNARDIVLGVTTEFEANVLLPLFSGSGVTEIDAIFNQFHDRNPPWLSVTIDLADLDSIKIGADSRRRPKRAPGSSASSEIWL